MSFGGFTSFANTILRNNLLVRERRMSWKELKDMYVDEAYRQATKDNKSFCALPADKSVIVALRKKLKRERRREFYRRLLVLVLTLVVGGVIVYWVLENVF